MRMWQDFSICKPAILIADAVQRRIAKAIVNNAAIADILHQSRAVYRRIAVLDAVGCGQYLRRVCDAQIRWPNNLVLAHGNPAQQLRDALTKGYLAD